MKGSTSEAAIDHGRDFLGISRRFLELLGPDGIGDEHEQQDFAVSGREPRWLLRPSSVEECAAALRIASELGLSIVPAGLGWRLEQGHPPASVDVVLSLARMDRVLDHAAADLTLTVEAGAPLAAVQATLREKGQWLALDPPAPELTTIGGLVAAHASGPSRQRFGTVRDALLGVRAVLADGTEVRSGGRVVKNVAGYDLHRLLVGSFGTLAVVVEASFKLWPLPGGTEVVTVRSDAGERLVGLAGVLARSGLEPRFLELFAGADERPFLEVGFSGVAADLAAARVALGRTAATVGGLEVSASAGEDALGDRIRAIAGPGEDVVVLRGGARPRSFRTWLGRALDRFGDAAGRVSAHAHAGVGVARLRLEEVDAATFAAAFEALAAEARAGGGYLVAERCPADLVATIDPWGGAPAAPRLQDGIRHAFDPAGLLAPGRFVGRS